METIIRWAAGGIGFGFGVAVPILLVILGGMIGYKIGRDEEY